ncbi:MAG: DUF4249 family protein [Fidelibacterota bacterium]
MKRLLPFFILLFLGLGCIDSKWEDVTSNYKSELNVFAFISLDDSIPTFIQVRQTLGLEGPVWEVVGTDTFWYGEDLDEYQVYNVLESRFNVTDAVVQISDNDSTYNLFLIEDEYQSEQMWYFDNFWSGSIYIDTLGLFIPEPEKTYFLTVKTPDGRELIGEVTTPPLPEIIEDSVPDSIDTNRPYTIKFKTMPNHYSRMMTSSYNWICGAEHADVIEKGDSTWTASVENCGGDTSGWDQSNTLTIELITMDDNYYEYFIKHGHDDEFVNFLMGAGGSGPEFGVEGGYGTFCAVATARIKRPIIPK